MKALFTLTKLSTAEKDFLKSKKITGEYTPDEWLNLFTRLRDFDKERDTSSKLSGRMGCIGLVICFLGLCTLVLYVGLLMLPIGLILAFIGLPVYFYLKRFDIPGEVLTSNVLPIVKIMREEMNPAEKLKLRLDLRGFEQRDKLLNQSDPYKRGAYYKIIDSTYKDQWIDGEAVLADGTKLIWSIFDFVKNSKKSKRNQRGKYKTKTKESHRSLIQLQVAMNEKRYALPSKLKQKGREGAILTKKSGDYNWMRIRKMIKHQVGQKFTILDFVNVVASAYSRATPVRGKR